MIKQSTFISTGEPSWAAWLTVERAAYIGVALLAVLVRFFNLGLYPLAPAEAHQALTAWQLAQGESVGLVSGVSPLLLSLNHVLFLLTLGGDEWARLLPALAGAILVLLPYGLRHEMGRRAALGSALLLALSPTGVLFSRTVDGHSLAMLAALLALVAVARTLAGDRAWGAWAGAGVAAAVSSASGGVTAILALALGLAWFAPGETRDFPASLRRLLRAAALPAVLVFVLGSTLLLTFWPGLGAAADVIGQWLAHITPAADAPPFWWPLLRLLVDEPVLLFGALLGLGFWAFNADFRRQLTWPVKTAALWAGLALLLALLGRQPADGMVIAVPLALLAAQAFDWLLMAVKAGPRWAEEWIVLLSSLVLSVTFTLYLASWTQAGQSQYLVAALVLFGLLLVLYVLSGFWIGVRATAGIAVVLGLLVLGAAQVGHLWALNQAELPRQVVLAYQTASTADSRALADTLVNRSAHRYGDDYRFQVDVVESPTSDVARWYVRDFQRVRLVTSPTTAVDTDAVIQPLLETPTPPSADFVGASYTIARRWTPDGLSGAPLARWLLFNDAKTPTKDEKVVLWVKGTE
jgi:hypothetical protein